MPCSQIPLGQPIPPGPGFASPEKCKCCDGTTNNFNTASDCWFCIGMLDGGPPIDGQCPQGMTVKTFTKGIYAGRTVCLSPAPHVPPSAFSDPNIWPAGAATNWCLAQEPLGMMTGGLSPCCGSTCCHPYFEICENGQCVSTQ